jgi:hypothetical protein
MRRFQLFVGLTLLLTARTVLAQTVQLPSYHYFSVQTSVLVPDRGIVSLGGVNRSASGQNQFGAPGLRGNRATGAAAQASGLSISAQIHDFEAMDQALLEQAAAMRKSSHGSRDFTQRTFDPPPIQANEPSQQKRTPAEDAKTLFARGDAASREGKLGAARVYYQMAARRATGPLHDQAIAKYHALAVKSQAASGK